MLKINFINFALLISFFSVFFDYGFSKNRFAGFKSRYHEEKKRIKKKDRPGFVRKQKVRKGSDIEEDVFKTREKALAGAKAFFLRRKKEPLKSKHTPGSVSIGTLAAKVAAGKSEKEVVGKQTVKAQVGEGRIESVSKSKPKEDLDSDAGLLLKGKVKEFEGLGEPESIEKLGPPPKLEGLEDTSKPKKKEKKRKTKRVVKKEKKGEIKKVEKDEYKYGKITPKVEEVAKENKVEINKAVANVDRSIKELNTVVKEIDDFKKADGVYSVSRKKVETLKEYLDNAQTKQDRKKYKKELRQAEKELKKQTKQLKKIETRVEDALIKTWAEEEDLRDIKMGQARKIIKSAGINNEEVKIFADSGVKLQEANQKVINDQKIVDEQNTTLDLLKKEVEEKQKNKPVPYREEGEGFDTGLKQLSDDLQKKYKSDLDKLNASIKKTQTTLNKAKKNLRDSEELQSNAKKEFNNFMTSFREKLKKAGVDNPDETIKVSIEPSEKTKEKRRKSFISRNKGKIAAGIGLVGVSGIGGFGLAGGAVSGTGLAAGTTMFSSQDETVATEEAEDEEPVDDFSDYDFNSYYDEFSSEY